MKDRLRLHQRSSQPWIWIPSTGIDTSTQSKYTLKHKSLYAQKSYPVCISCLRTKYVLLRIISLDFTSHTCTQKSLYAQKTYFVSTSRTTYANPFKKPYMYAKDAHRFIKPISDKFLSSKTQKYIHYNNSYNALNAPHYSRVGERFTHGETVLIELNTPKTSLFPFYRNALEQNWEQNSHSYKDVHDKNQK